MISRRVAFGDNSSSSDSILRHSRRRDTPDDDKILKVDEAEGDDDSENGQGWNVEEAGG